MKKLIITILLGMIVFASLGVASASPPVPTPNCQIEGIITHVQFIEAQNNNCTDFNICMGNHSIENCCAEDQSPFIPELYKLTVKIEKVSQISFNENYYGITCDSLYPINSAKQLTIYESNVKTGDNFQSGQEINASVSYSVIYGNYDLINKATKVYCEDTPTNLDCVCKNGVKQQKQCAVGEICPQMIIYECINQTQTCAKENEMFSKVYSDYPKTCCEGLTEWDSGMDTRKVENGKCIETGRLAGAPVGTCIKCGDGVCGEKENLCNCPADCGKVYCEDDPKDSNCKCKDGIKTIESCPSGYVCDAGATYICVNQNKTCAGVGDWTSKTTPSCCPGLKEDKKTHLCIAEGKKVGWFRNMYERFFGWFNFGNKNSDKPSLNASVIGECDESIDPYSPPIAGILNQTWKDDKTLSVETYVKYPCGGASFSGEFAIEGNKLILKYDTIVPPGEPVTTCNCAHKIVYTISNLKKKDYEVSIVRNGNRD